MKRTIYAAAILTVALGAACSKNENSATPPQTEKNPITFTTHIEALTRAPHLGEDGSGSFSPGDTFTLLAGDKNGQMLTFDYSVGATALKWSDLTFAQADGSVDFAACYPQQKLNGKQFEFTVSQDAAGDLLLAQAAGVSVGSQKPVALNFRHAMHRLVVKYTVKDPTLSASDIETLCTALNSCTVEPLAGKVEAGKSTETFQAKDLTASLLLVPQPAKGVKLEIRAGKASKSCMLNEVGSCPETLEGGKILTVNLTIEGGSISIDGTTIEGWGSQGSIDDEIIL